MLALILLGGEARAWGDLGHKVVCEIAFRSVLPNTQAAINRLMQLDSEFKSFSNSCIYPDHPRIRAPEHFLKSASGFQRTYLGPVSAGRRERDYRDLVRLRNSRSAKEQNQTRNSWSH